MTTGPRRSAAPPAHGLERAFAALRHGGTALVGLLLAISACSDDSSFSPVTLESGPHAAVPVPSQVSDLDAEPPEEDSGTSATLTWTEVEDGEDEPASYEVRLGTSPIEDWSEADTAEDGSCAGTVEGREIGAELSCDVEGLSAGETYDFSVAAFRLEPDGSRLYSPERSNTATVELPGTAKSGGEDDGSGDGGGSTGGGGSKKGGSDGGTSGGGDGSGDDGGTGDGSEAEPYPNRPDGFSPLAESSYASSDEGGWRTADDADFSIASDPDAPRSPSEVGQARFPAGWGGGYAPITSTASLSDAGVRRLYISFWVKLSDNWQGHPVVNKIGYFWTHGSPAVTAVYRGAGDDPLHSQVRIQDVPDGARNLDPNLENPEIVRGRWHRWEILLVSNTGDAADGEIHWWIDGQKAGEYDAIRFGTSADTKIWNYASWKPIWGGAGSTVRETMHMWMDHYHVAGAP